MRITLKVGSYTGGVVNKLYLEYICKDLRSLLENTAKMVLNGSCKNSSTIPVCSITLFILLILYIHCSNAISKKGYVHNSHIDKYVQGDKKRILIIQIVLILELLSLISL